MNDILRPRLTVLAGTEAPGVRSDGARPVSDDRIKVAVVDDSVVVRGLMSRWLGEEASIHVVGTYRTGVDALAGVVRTQPDILVLDIEMPDMDGMVALPLLLKLRPGLVVIMASTLTARHAEISLKCLALGAVDYIPKPSTHREVSTSAEFRRNLLEKVLNLAPRRLRPHISTAHGATPNPDNVVSLRADMRGSLLATRPRTRNTPRAVLIGASTGGPQAISILADALGKVLEQVPVLITQHMPATFTSMFAEHLRKRSGLDVVEAVDHEPVRPGRVYVAPGGLHMVVEPFGRFGAIRLMDDPPVNFCRPSVDRLYESAAHVFGADVIAVTLTGMGSDGLGGASRLAKLGATVIAQDEASSVVWGMPGAIARTGLCNAILPINRIAASLASVLAGGQL